MSFNIHFADCGLGLILKRSVGTATSSELAHALTVFFKQHNEALSALRYVYIDYTEADKLKVTTEDILQFVEIAKIIASKNSELVVAICAPEFENYCITKTWEVHLPDDFGWVTTAFRDPDPAKSWLKKVVQDDLRFV